MIARAERGVAVVTAILIVAVAASAATYMLAQQSATLGQTALVASRAQADQYAQAGFDWAKGILADDARTSSTDTLEEAWARPIAGLPVERAVVNGRIFDAQARFNLNNVVKDGKKSEPDVQTLRRLLASVRLDAELANAIVDWIDADADPSGQGGAEDSYYLSLPVPYRAGNRPLAQVEELHRVRGFDAKAVAALAPLVTAIEARTPVNANTADVPVLAAILPELSLEEVRALVAARKAMPFKDKADFMARAKKAPLATVEADLDVKSAWFLVQVGVGQDDVQVAFEALVTRGAAGASPASAIYWRRPLY